MKQLNIFGVFVADLDLESFVSPLCLLDKNNIINASLMNVDPAS